jgi:DNA-binding SARP family transcriptional activator
MTVELRLLGGASLLTADGQLVSAAAAQPRRSAVLAVLAEAWPAAVTRDRLVGLIWPEQDDAGARRLLTQSLYELRRELGDVTRSASRDIAVDADALRVDLIDFRRALETRASSSPARRHGTAPRRSISSSRWTHAPRR